MPKALRDQAQHAIWLADRITDEQARTALFALAQELAQKAAQIESATPAGATATAAAMLETTDGKPPQDEDLC